jgi:two-component system sensor histidine kinase/response regulator
MFVPLLNNIRESRGATRLKTKAIARRTLSQRPVVVQGMKMKKLLAIVLGDSHLGARLGLSFGLLIAILLSVGWVGIRQLHRVDQDLGKMVDVQWQDVQLSWRAQSLSNDNNRLTMQIFLANEPEIEALMLERAANTDKISRLIKTLGTRVESKEEQELLDAVVRTRSPYAESYQNALQLLVVGKNPEAARAVMIDQALPRLIDYHDAWNAYVDYQGHQMDFARESDAVTGVRTRETTVLLTVLAVLFAIVMAIMVTRNITSHVNNIRRAEAALRQAHDELEEKVRNRTAELAKANEGLGADLTERKRIEAELKSHEQSMSEAQRIAHLGSWEHHGASGQVTWSPEEWRIFGLDRREFGPPFEEFLALVHPDDRHIVKKINEKSPESKKDLGYDYRIIRPDGTVRVLRANAKIQCDDLGQVVKITGTDQDITEQNAIEEELKRSELELLEAQNIARLGAWGYDIATNTTTWSPTLYDIYGVKPEDTEPTLEGYLGLIHPDDRGRVSEIAQAAFQTGEECSYGHRIIWPDQSIHFLHVNQRVVLDEAGHPLKIFGTAQDVTDRVELEEELKRARDTAIESARLKSEFLANMSHEIRTPMNGVIGMTGLLLDTQLDADQRDFAETIRSSGDALLTIINDILDFSKIEAGKLQFEMLDFQLNSAAEDTIDLLAERAHDKNIELACLVYSDVPTALRGDPGRLRQVLTNLLGNAIKFTERGEVILRAEKQSETEHDVVIRFQITDTGIGISEAAQRNLFQAFTQADGSTTRKYGGTGLGLAISKQLVELMGGEIGINSRLGQGSTVWFTAKFAKQPTGAVGATWSPGSLDQLRVLIVDDNATNRKILSHQVASWGMIHREVDSGTRALELLQSTAAAGAPFDLAVLDFMMPGMDGFELARRIKSDPEIAPVKLVMLTSFGERGHGAAARKAGVAAYLTKPVRQSQLFDCLADVIGAAPTVPAPDVSPLPAKLVTRHTLKESAMMSRRLILLAEDNVVNQKVALRQLLKLGYRADAVANGREILEALERIPYDLVLMDCQMPEMDGYEATSEIRRREGTAKHTLIVAMTANALAGDRAKCIAAGMDDYVSKPVRPEELGAVLERMFGDQGKGVQQLGAFREKTAAPVDMKQLSSAVGDEPQERAEILEVYLDQMVTNLERLETAIELQDAATVDLISHNCAGTSANCGMVAVVDPLREMERMGRENHLDGATVLLADIGREFGRVQSFLEENLKVVAA